MIINHAYPNQDTESTILDLSGPEFVELLDSRIEAIHHAAAATDMWRALRSPETPTEFLRLTMREMYLEISSYQPHAVEAAITAISQMPRSLDGRTVKAMRAMGLVYVENQARI